VLIGRLHAKTALREASTKVITQMAPRYWSSVPTAGLVWLVVSAGSANLKVIAQHTGPPNPPLIIKSVAGRDLFDFYCAPCHGRDGKGGGPVAGALRVAPPDLTTIATANGGTFPKSQVEATLTGTRMPAAHGSREMPIWGPIFSALDSNDARNRVRIGNVVEYIASMQIK
jgi:mono/diheme cytochrome c family protein